MKGIKISACIITYNQQDYIRECLEGAINQVVLCDYEIVIGDDCSTDQTNTICLEYAQKYPEKIKLLSREKNLGMAKNWVNTISECQGNYIAICEGDDYWTDSNKLQKQIDFLEAHPECSFSFHKAVRFDARNAAHNKIYPQNITKTILNPKDFYAIPTIPTASVVFRNPVQIPNLMHSHLDTLLYASLLSKGDAGFINEQMSFYRLHDEGISNEYSQNWYMERRINELKIEKNLPEFASNVRSEIQKVYIDHVILYLNRNRGKLSFSQKMNYLKLICGSKYFYAKSLKEYLILFKTILK